MMLRSSSIACLSAALGDTGLSSTANIFSKYSRCRPSSYLLAVLATFLANSSPVFLCESSEVFPHFVLTNKNNSTSVSRSSRLTVQSSGERYTIDVIFHISQNSSKYGQPDGYDDQKRRNILNE